MFTIEVDESGYQLVADSGEESGVTDYGDTAEVEVDGKTYGCLVDSREDALAEPPEVYLLLEETPVVEEMEFDLEDEDEEEGGEGEPVTA